jgi:hypothetical protein
MNLKEMYSSKDYQSYTESKLGNDLFINDADRASRMHEAAEEGCEGSTHAEIIEDWREYLNALKITDEDECGYISQEDFDNITKEIDACEEWHQKNGSLHQQIG